MINRNVFFSLLIACALCMSFVFSPLFHLNTAPEFANEIVFQEDGIFAYSKNKLDTLFLDTTKNSFVYGYPCSSSSFWYKIYIQSDGEFTFDIFPEKKENTYNFFLYKVADNMSIEDVQKGNFPPVRENLFMDEMSVSGIGLSASSAVSYEKSIAKNRVKDLYHSAYHAPVAVKAGEIYMLNIYHIKGNDNGFRFVLRNGKYSRQFHAVYDDLFSQRAASRNLKRKVELPMKNLPVAESPTITIVNEVTAENNHAKNNKIVLLVKDSVRKSFLNADVSYCEKRKTIDALHTDAKGMCEIIADKNKVGYLVISALGYKSRKIMFADLQKNINAVTEVALSPVGEGDDFVMDKIYFYPNTFSIKQGGLEEVDKLAAYLNQNPFVKVEVQGHTSGNKKIKASRHGNEEEGSFTGTSKKLSQLRAETIRQYLIQKGINQDRITAVGYGGSKMIYPHPKNQSEANKNIRVAILILSQKNEVASKK